MATYEMRVINEIVRTRTMEEARKAGFHAGLVKDPEALGIYNYLEQVYNNRASMRQVPLPEEIQRKFPYFRQISDQEGQNNIGVLVQALKMRSMETDLMRVRDLFNELLEDKSEEEALSLLIAQLPHLITKYKRSSGFGITEILAGMKKSYEGVRSGLALGIPWPWECLTEDTLGKNKGDFIVFYGRMKSAKTWLLLKSAVDDYVKYHQRVIIWSREMDARKMQLRIASIMAGVDYQLLKKGKLPGAVYRRAVRTLEAMALADLEAKSDVHLRSKRGYADLIVLAGPDAPRNIAELQAAVKMYQPDILYLDSFYHLESDRARGNSQMWAKIQYLSEDIKGIALDEDIPIVAVAQANRSGEKGKGEDLTEVAGGDAIAREADLMIRVIKKQSFELPQPKNRLKMPLKWGDKRIPKKCLNGDCDDDKNEDVPLTGMELVLVLPGNREGVLEAFTLEAVPGYKFEVINDRLSGAAARALLDKDQKRPEKEIRKGGTRPKPKEEEPEIPFSFDFRKGAK